MLIESKKYKGFYKSILIEELEGVYVSEDGIIINEKDDYCFLPKVGYHQYNVIYYCGSHTVHRLVCKVFHYQSYASDKIINHKDGDKFNNHKDNVEWCTYQENSLHAYQSGLRSDNIIIYVKDLRNKETKQFYSLWEASRQIEINAGIISRYLNTDRSLPLRHFFSVWTNELKEIPYSDEQLNQIRKGLPKTVVVEIKDDKQFYVFDSATYAAEYYNVNPGTFRLWINDGRFHDKIKAWYIHDYKENKDKLKNAKTFERHEAINKLRKMPNKPPIPVEITNTLTEEVKIYPSTQVFADEVGVKKNTIQKRAWVTKGFWNHYHLKYLK